MNFIDLQIQTSRTAPAEFKSPGISLLYRAGYLHRDKSLTMLGKLATQHIEAKLTVPSQALHQTEAATFPGLVGNQKPGSFFLAHPIGPVRLTVCTKCHFSDRFEIFPIEQPNHNQTQPKAPQIVFTPNCDTIAGLANYLGIQTSQTSKALMFTSTSNGEFIIVTIRGDQTLSEAKLKNLVGDVRMATIEEIIAAGAVPGYASPIGNVKGLVIADHAVDGCPNLVAGANKVDHHLVNTMCGRDYLPNIVADVVLPNEGTICPNCHAPTQTQQAFEVIQNGQLRSYEVLLYLSETNSDDKGLRFPLGINPYDVYLMNIPGTTIDTAIAMRAIYEELIAANIATLADDRNERAGIKFNDADLIGLPIRITVGERGLTNNEVEVKLRGSAESSFIQLATLLPQIIALMEPSKW